MTTTKNTPYTGAHKSDSSPAPCSTFFKREERYVVLKVEDIKRHLSYEAQETLEIICGGIRHGRRSRGKDDPRYVVVNQKEPYAEKVWKLIEDHSS